MPSSLSRHWTRGSVSARGSIAGSPSITKALATSPSASQEYVDVLGTSDIVIGAAIAIALAFVASYLQGQRNNPDIILWKNSDNENNRIRERTKEDSSVSSSVSTATTTAELMVQNNNTSVVFDDWKEMTLAENYVFYNPEIRRKLSSEGRDRNKSRTQSSSSSSPNATTAAKTEKKWVVASLLLLFVPIFSAEFFLALSRGILCEIFSTTDLAVKLCSPVVSV